MNMKLNLIDRTETATTTASVTNPIVMYPTLAGCESRHSGGCITGDTNGLRPSTRFALERLSRLGVRPDRLWDEDFVRRMAWVVFEADREVTAWLKYDGTVAELCLGNSRDCGNDFASGHANGTHTAPVTDWCIRAGIGERRTVPERERLMLLRGELRRAVLVGVGMGLPGTISLGWRSPAGTGGVILYTGSRTGVGNSFLRS